MILNSNHMAVNHMEKSGVVYIMTNKNRTTLYVGVTSNLCQRVFQHCHHVYRGSFTERYNLEYCIYFEEFPSIGLAIKREKVIKKWNRKKKEILISKINPEWDVLITEVGFTDYYLPFSERVKILSQEMTQNEKLDTCDNKKDNRK